jgi:hypothetical protein
MAFTTLESFSVFDKIRLGTATFGADYLVWESYIKKPFKPIVIALAAFPQI